MITLQKEIKVEVWNHLRIEHLHIPEPDETENWVNAALGKIKLIVITDKGGDFPFMESDTMARLHSSLFIRFNDETDNVLEAKAKSLLMTDTDAKLIDTFIEQDITTVDTIIVSCKGGVSRSPAIAAAIKLKLNQSDDDIWDNGEFTPNVFCFKQMLNAFDPKHMLNVNIKDREQRNLEAWKMQNQIF